MRVLDKRSRISRRGFLKSSAASTAAVGALSGGMVSLPALPAWAGSLKAIDPAAAKTLLVMVRDLYPHDRLGDGYYERAIAAMDEAAAKEPALGRQLNEGAAALDAAAQTQRKTPYAALKTEEERVAVLKSMEATPFFQKVRGDMVVALYNQPEVWAKLGYEGPSAELGGYLHRGFDDIDWIKEA
ncbi:twin-arginine translocation signal domain-containing protein [Azospirillum sp. RWY-5-1]|uniref:Twin-arginine translocation signal domain-containing protein n=1 Tax=Azospirillum oleiclasticum TaxID=2735135 RepID=A0ABX2T975_9PROT|nr:twin-arginine translocation signal domain-containing protein [Azospirillum oleiclasticum]NYZ13911.1 twin-arginine translocation signal domain-containing protein [Azospirillum oleiclasticum]NYZ20835.1 twin-arginine translocation signal domain-containing protein [Azospirillum oleiclasticum]